MTDKKEAVEFKIMHHFNDHVDWSIKNGDDGEIMEIFFNLQMHLNTVQGLSQIPHQANRPETPLKLRGKMFEMMEIFDQPTLIQLMAELHNLHVRIIDELKFRKSKLNGNTNEGESQKNP